jgi:hypothetical protein
LVVRSTGAAARAAPHAKRDAPIKIAFFILMILRVLVRKIKSPVAIIDQFSVNSQPQMSAANARPGAGSATNARPRGCREDVQPATRDGTNQLSSSFGGVKHRSQRPGWIVIPTARSRSKK